MTRRRQLSYEDALDHKEAPDVERLRAVIDLSSLSPDERKAVTSFLDGEDDLFLPYLQSAMRKMRAVASVMRYHAEDKRK